MCSGSFFLFSQKNCHENHLRSTPQKTKPSPANLPADTDPQPTSQHILLVDQTTLPGNPPLYKTIYFKPIMGV